MAGFQRTSPECCAVRLVYVGLPFLRAQMYWGPYVFGCVFHSGASSHQVAWWALRPMWQGWPISSPWRWWTLAWGAKLGWWQGQIFSRAWKSAVFLQLYSCQNYALSCLASSSSSMWTRARLCLAKGVLKVLEINSFHFMALWLPHVGKPSEASLTWV